MKMVKNRKALKGEGRLLLLINLTESEYKIFIYLVESKIRTSLYMTVSSSAAERVVDDILSSNYEIISAGVIDRSGNIIANKSKESFRKRFEVVRNLERNRYSGTLAVAALGIANEVRDAFGEPQALITIYRDCKLMLLPVPSYDLLIGLALELSVDVENNTFAKEMERLVARTLKP